MATTISMAAASVALGCATATGPVVPGDDWSSAEREQIRSLWIGSLGPLAPDPTNRFADEPGAVALGHRIFFDARFSGNGQVACATCHRPELEFQDGVPLGVGVGTTDRRTMPIAGTAHSPWQFWDGRADSQWGQALGPLESPVEHGGTRAQYAHLIAEYYRADYEAVFGPLPPLADVPRRAGPVEDPGPRAAWERMTAGAREDVTRVYANIGKAIAAYERRIHYGPSRFDRYAERLLAGGRPPASILGPDEEAGLRLFIGRAGCVNCHNGPLFTNNDFHNTGVPAVASLPEDRGRLEGARRVLTDEFNCRSRYSDAGAGQCAELDFLVVDGHEQVRAFKVPSLRNVAERPPYMHAGQITTLADVVRHYDRAPAAPLGHSELRPLGLRARERAQLEAFLGALSGPTVAPPGLLEPPR